MESPSKDRPASLVSAGDIAIDARKKALEKLKSDTDECENRDVIISAIRALLVTNKEILERCKESKVESDYPNDRPFGASTAKTKSSPFGTSSPLSPFDPMVCGPFGASKAKPATFGAALPPSPFVRILQSKTSLSLTFKRTNYSTVKVRTVGGNAEFVAFPRVEKETFDTTPLHKLPSHLNEFSFRKTNEFDSDGFVDFTAFLNDCMLLHDDIVLPLLVQLMHHLELVEVCLGRIEQWLMEANDIKNTVESILGTIVSFENDPLLSSYVLKRVPFEGKLEVTYNLSGESDRNRLIKCLDFVSSCQYPAPKSPGESFRDKFKLQPDEWKCNACFVKNSKEKAKCVCCDSLKDDRRADGA